MDCHERALRLLSVRPRSRHELRTRLLRAGFEEAEVEAELARLEAVGLVDDDAFAQQAVEQELTVRRSGRRAIAGRLAARGVDRRAVERAISELATDDEGDRAIELARSRSGRLSGVPVDKAFTRLVAFLMRRGYGPEVARLAARTALRVDGEA